MDRFKVPNKNMFLYKWLGMILIIYFTRSLGSETLSIFFISIVLTSFYIVTDFLNRTV